MPGQHTPGAKSEGAHFSCDRPGAQKTNVVVPGVIGTSVYKDMREPNASRRFKALGGDMDSHLGVASDGGVCTSPDGIRYDPSDCITWANIPNMHWDSWWNMFYDTVSHNLVATGRASNHSNPCGTNFYPGCDKGQFFPPAARGEQSSKKPKCGMEDCFFANRAISRVHTTGTDLRTMGQNAQGNQVVTQGTGPNDQLCKRKRCKRWIHFAQPQPRACLQTCRPHFRIWTCGSGW